MKTIPFLLCIAFLCNMTAMAQDNDQAKRRTVLEQGIIDSVFVFGQWTEKGSTETHLKYLGEVTTMDGRVFKVMTSIWLWGLSRHATNKILIYNGKNQYVGNYYMSIMSDLPDKLEDGRLIFTNYDNEDCDRKLITKVNLKKGLPTQFFLKCQGQMGDIYTFE